MRRFTIAAAASLLFLFVGVVMAEGGCGKCRNAGTSACDRQAAIPASVLLLSIDGDTVDLVKEMELGPKVLFTFSPDSAGNKVAAVVQQAWAGLDDSMVSALGIVCGTRQQALASREELGLGFPLVLDQGCAGSLVLGLDYCPGAAFVRADGSVSGRVYQFAEQIMTQEIAMMLSPAEYIDPVCGTPINPEEAAATYEYNGKTYYFCTTGCRDAFVAHPDKYLNR